MDAPITALSDLAVCLFSHQTQFSSFLKTFRIATIFTEQLFTGPSYVEFGFVFNSTGYGSLYLRECKGVSASYSPTLEIGFGFLEEPDNSVFYSLSSTGSSDTDSMGLSYFFETSPFFYL